MKRKTIHREEDEETVPQFSEWKTTDREKSEENSQSVRLIPPLTNDPLSHSLYLTRVCTVNVNVCSLIRYEEK